MPKKRKKLLVEFEAAGMSWSQISYSVSPGISDYFVTGYEIWAYLS